MLNKVFLASWRKLALTQVLSLFNTDLGHQGPQVFTRSVLRRPSFERERPESTGFSLYYGKTIRISFRNESILLGRHVRRHIVKKDMFLTFFAILVELIMRIPNLG